MNAHGVKLATDLDQILSDVAALIVNRNTNEHLQKAIFYGTKATAESFKQVCVCVRVCCLSRYLFSFMPISLSVSASLFVIYVEHVFCCLQGCHIYLCIC